MKYATIHDPATCERRTIYFDFSNEITNASEKLTWFCTDGYSSMDAITGDEEERIDKLSKIGAGESKSYWLRRNGGDYDALSDIHTATPGDYMYKQFREDFKKVCGFFPKFK